MIPGSNLDLQKQKNKNVKYLSKYKILSFHNFFKEVVNMSRYTLFLFLNFFKESLIFESQINTVSNISGIGRHAYYVI